MNSTSLNIYPNSTKKSLQKFASLPSRLSESKSSIKTALTASKKEFKLPTLEMTSVSSAYESFILKYDPKIVEPVFQQIIQTYPTSAPKIEIDRAEIYCHFFDMEKQVYKDLKPEDKKIQRVFNRYHFHVKNEGSSNLQGQGTPLTHEDINKSKENFKIFAQMIPDLINRYGESICLRALNHFSVLPTDVLCGQSDFLTFENLCLKIDLIFKQEQKLASLIDAMPYEALQNKYNLLQMAINDLKDPYGKLDLTKELNLKCGKIKLLIPLVDKIDIEAQAKLFNVSADATRWANSLEKLTPIDSSIHKNINHVYFLKSAHSQEKDPNLNPYIAVFKSEPSGSPISGAMEAIAYDVSLLFGISSGIVPTKQTKLKGMQGSLQIFQDGITWAELAKKSRAERKNIVSKISMRSFLEALLPILVLGNRDVHSDNFFFVKKKVTPKETLIKNSFNQNEIDNENLGSAQENEISTPNSIDETNQEDEYKIVVFDNGLSFQYSNYILTSIYKEKVSKVQNIFTTLLNEKKPLQNLSTKKEALDNKKNLNIKKTNNSLRNENLFKDKASKKVSLNQTTVNEKTITAPHESTSFNETLHRSLPANLAENKGVDSQGKTSFQSMPNMKLVIKEVEETLKAVALEEPEELTTEEEEVTIRESLLPIRCAIFALPHADEVIKGDDLIWLQELVNTWPKKFENFFTYLNSPAGQIKLKNLYYKKLDNYQLKAFNDRLQKIINIVNGKKPFTPRDIVIKLYPLYHDFYALSQMLYPDYTEFAVGAKTAEYLCKKAVRHGKITQEKADQFLEHVYKCAYK